MKRSLVLLLFLGVTFSVQAQEINSADSTICLSMSEAQDMALERNRTLINATLDVQKAEANHWKAISSMLPQANASVDYSNMLGYEMDLGTIKISMPASATIGVNAAVALSGAQIISTQLTSISKKMADISLMKSEQDIKDQVKVLYFSALVMEETATLLEKNLESLKTLHTSTQSSVDVGAAEQVDADQILVQVATMQTTLNSTNRSKEMVYNSLRLQLNISPTVNIVLTQKLDELQDIENSLSLLEEDFNLDNNYSYQLVKQNTDLTKQQVNLAGWAYGPSVSLFYQYSYKKYFSNDPTMNMTPPNMVGATLSIPIFSSGNKYSALKDAQLAYKKQQNVMADTQDALLIQHRQLCFNLSSAYESFQTQKKNLEVTQKVFENISKKFEFGMVSSVEVTTSGTSLISAQSSYVQALLEFVNAQIELETLLNK